MTAPPKAMPVLQIGFTGHRALDEASRAPLQAALAAATAEITAAAQAALAAGWPGVPGARLELRGVCALAAGADQMAAREMLAAGWTLLAALPFARENYRGDFSEAEIPGYEALLSRAAAVYELDGTPGDNEAYRSLGHLILEQSDLLVAVWDGDTERGPGGTGEVVREARAADIPVLVIDARPPHATRLLTAGGAHRLADIVTNLLAPPRKGGAGDELAIFYGEERRHAPSAAVRLARLEQLLLAGAPPPPSLPIAEDSAGIDAGFTAAEAILAPALAATDQLAVRYAMLYRASITLRWLAVFPSAFAALVLLYFQGPWSAPLSLVAYLIGLAIFLIGFNDRYSGWHRRFLDYRFMAEHLRHAPLLAMFGSTRTLPRLPPYQAAASSDWVNWYLRFTLRKLGLVAVRRDAGLVARLQRILTAQLRGQIAFYARRAGEAEILARRLHAATAIAYFAALGLGILAAALKLVSLPDVEAALAGAGGAAVTAALRVLVLLAASAGIFGMIWPAISGYRAQREYSRLAQRYAAMMRQLGQLETRLARDGAVPGQTERVAREAVEAMLAEVSDWRVLIKARDFGTY